MTCAYPPAPPPTGNGFGTTALVLGVVGLLFSFVPVVGVIAWPLVILGVIFAVLGFIKLSEGRAANRGVVIAGAVCSGLGLLVCIAWVVGIASAMSDPTPMAQGTSAAPVRIAPVTPIAPAPAMMPTATTIPGTGTYLVGSEITPGTYRSAGAKRGVFEVCYWSRLRDTSGAANAILDWGTAGPDDSVIMTIAPSDGMFRSSNCEGWARIK